MSGEVFAANAFSRFRFLGILDAEPGREFMGRDPDPQAFIDCERLG